MRMPSIAPARYSICTMVTNWAEHAACLATFRERGFIEQDCEVLTLDNTAGNRADAFIATNEFLQAARGTYVILVHQDVLLLTDDRTKLDRLLDQLSARDSKWGACGNAGHTRDGWPVLCISHPHDEKEIVGGPFPTQVMSLDENLMVVRREANLAVSGDLVGFHHYGADLCTIADILGWNTYVIDFFLRHNSGGTVDAVYERSREAIAGKYRRALRPRWVHLITRQPYFISGRKFEGLLAWILRKAGKAVGLVPRHADLDDPLKRAARDQRKARHP